MYLLFVVHRLVINLYWCFQCTSYNNLMRFIWLNAWSARSWLLFTFIQFQIIDVKFINWLHHFLQNELVFLINQVHFRAGRLVLFQQWLAVCLAMLSLLAANFWVNFAGWNLEKSINCLIWITGHFQIGLASILTRISCAMLHISLV